VLAWWAGVVGREAGVVAMKAVSGLVLVTAAGCGLSAAPGLAAETGQTATYYDRNY
jgi:hypothetical protein